MSKLFFDQYGTEPELVLPYQEIGVGVILAYDRKASIAGTLASVRKISDEADTEFLAIDGLNFLDNWFGIEFGLGDRFRSAKIQLKGYPARQVYPKVYFDGGSVDMNPLEISESVTELNFSATHMRFAGLPEGGQNLRLALMVPSCEWFVVGLYSVEVVYA